MSFVPLVKSWIWISVAASAAGWLLSIIGQLNHAGYLVAGILCVGAFWWARRGRETGVRLRWNQAKLAWRFSHPLPFCFAVLALLVLVGGLLYPPTNHTGLTYRTPRVLQWLAQEHWFWIHTPNYRMNNRACGFEWLTAPVLLFTRSDRLLFLINFVPFLLLPGLIYSVFTRLGVQPRVAWHWMWVIPTGYSFLLQANSIANDTFPTIYALAAVDFAARAWGTRRPSEWSLSILAAALLTGAKASNVPLLLPWAVLALPLVGVWRHKPIYAAGIMLLAGLVSFLPTAILNIIYCGDWSGLRLERAGMDMRNPLTGVWGNALLLLVHNLIPPVFPMAGSWNQNILTLLPGALVRPLVANFEQGFHQVLELQTEDWAGFGFGATLLVIISTLAAFYYRRQRPVSASGRSVVIPTLLWRLALISPWIALLAYCMKSGMVTGARLISPYYPLLLPLLLVAGGHQVVVRRRWWQGLSLAVAALALLVIVLTPSRPLWPAQTILTQMQDAPFARASFQRGLKAYSVYANRSDPMAHVRMLLPKDLRRVGFMADGDDMDISLWRPFGSRQVEHILLRDSGSQIRHRRIRYAVVGGAHLAANGVALADWLQQTEAQLLSTATVTLKVTEGPQPWYLVEFKEVAGTADFD